jgi:hypothetical protein
MERLDPQYHYDEDEPRQSWQIPPRHDLIKRYRKDMEKGTFDFVRAAERDGDIHVVRGPSGDMLFNGNHRVMAAYEAGLTHVPGTESNAEGYSGK